jgi:hypothetical protein
LSFDKQTPPIQTPHRLKLPLSFSIFPTPPVFPDAVRDQLMTEQKEELPDDTQPKGRLKSFLNDGKNNDNVFDSNKSNHDGISTKPIAELFPETVSNLPSVRESQSSNRYAGCW